MERTVAGGDPPRVGAPSRWQRFAVEIAIVVSGLLLISIAIRIFDLDRGLSARFYRAAEVPHWWAKERSFWDAVYRLAVWPANLTAVCAFVLLIVSFVLGSSARRVLAPHLAGLRRPCMILVLTLAIGPGLLVNGIFKAEGGRPRPRDIVEFGGGQTFRPVGSIELGGRGHAFPSGHASMGFYFLAFYVIWRGSRRRVAAVALVGGVAAGLFIGFQRVAVGAHFLSDVIWAGGFDYITVLALDAVLPPRIGDSLAEGIDRGTDPT